MYGYIYKTTNLVNGKIYIGKHKASAFDPSYRGSGKLITAALDKYGQDNFMTELICSCCSLSELNEAEKQYIEKYNSSYSAGKGYNISAGGDGGATNAGMKLMHKGCYSKFVSPSDISQHLKEGYVLGPTEQFRDKLRNANSGRKGDKASFYGKHHSEHSKYLIGLASQGRPGYGDNNIAKRPEVRAKISNYALTHPNYFRSNKFRFVTDGVVEKRITIDTPIPEGFHMGRSPHTWVHDEVKEYCIPVSSLEDYLSKGKISGRLNKHTNCN